MIKLYGITNCDTVKKARQWLTAQGVEHEFHDFKKQGVPANRLADWQKAAGWEKVLNRQGTTWRKLTADEQARAGDATGAREVMLAHPSVIKRPVAEWGKDITVGFDAARWTELVG